MDNGYLVQWYAEGESDVITRIGVYTESDLWPIVNKAKQEDQRIIVYKVGKQLLDWSEPSDD